MVETRPNVNMFASEITKKLTSHGVIAKHFQGVFSKNSITLPLPLDHFAIINTGTVVKWHFFHFIIFYIL